MSPADLVVGPLVVLGAALLLGAEWLARHRGRAASRRHALDRLGRACAAGRRPA